MFLLSDFFTRQKDKYRYSDRVGFYYEYIDLQM